MENGMDRLKPVPGNGGAPKALDLEEAVKRSVQPPPLRPVTGGPNRAPNTGVPFVPAAAPQEPPKTFLRRIVPGQAPKEPPGAPPLQRLLDPVSGAQVHIATLEVRVALLTSQRLEEKLGRLRAEIAQAEALQRPAVAQLVEKQQALLALMAKHQIPSDWSVLRQDSGEYVCRPREE